MERPLFLAANVTESGPPGDFKGGFKGDGKGKGPPPGGVCKWYAAGFCKSRCGRSTEGTDVLVHNTLK